MTASKDAAKPSGAIGLMAVLALFASGCVATLDDDFEIVAAK